MFVMLITYSFDTDYVSVPCETEEEALCVLHQYMQDEIKLVKRERGYTPVVIEMDETEFILSYEDEENSGEVNAQNYTDRDYASYKVIEVRHNCESRPGGKEILVTEEMVQKIYDFCTDELNYHINESRCAEEYADEAEAEIYLLRQLGYHQEADDYERQMKKQTEEEEDDN